jgi:hypothetical protein
MTLPHENVFARLGPSGIQGIGVFAIVPIPKGTNIFANDRSDMVWVDEAELSGLPEPLRQLYTDFGVASDGKLGVPKNFNLLTTGWYLNEPQGEAPHNLGVTKDLGFVALRDIAPGEELTTRYADYSDQD